MYTQDYIKRMINQLVAALQMIIGLKAAGQYGQALQAIDQALEQLLGLKPFLIKRLSDEAIIDSLGQGESLDKDRLLILADLFKEEGDIYSALDRTNESFSSHLRALNFYIEASFAGDSQEQAEPDEKLEDLYHQLSKFHLPPPTLYGLFAYFENTGRYSKAIRILSILQDDPSLRDEVRVEQHSFYQRLRDKTDAELQEGGITRSEVEQHLAKSDNSD